MHKKGLQAEPAHSYTRAIDCFSRLRQQPTSALANHSKPAFSRSFCIKSTSIYRPKFDEGELFKDLFMPIPPQCEA